MNKRHARKARLMAHEFKSVLDSLGFTEVGVIVIFGKDVYRIAGRNLTSYECSASDIRAINEACSRITEPYERHIPKGGRITIETDGNDGHTSELPTLPLSMARASIRAAMV